MTTSRCACGHTAARHALHADDHPCRECRCDRYGTAPAPPAPPFRVGERPDAFRLAIIELPDPLNGPGPLIDLPDCPECDGVGEPECARCQGCGGDITAGAA